MGKNAVLLVLIASLLGFWPPANGLYLRHQEDRTTENVKQRPARGLQAIDGSVIDVSLFGLDDDLQGGVSFAATPVGNNDDSPEMETGGPFLGPEVFVEPIIGRESRATAAALEPTKRIIGGYDAEPHPFHSMLLLRYGGGWRWAGCGATLISNCHVVTAAHCAADPSKPLGAVFVNAHRPYQENGDVPFHFSPIDHVIRHAGFNATSNANDIAVIKMAQCLNTTEFPPAIPASPTMDIPSTLVGDILGFGKLSEQGNMFVNVEALQRAQVPVMPADTCKEYYGDKIKKDMFCGGFAEGGVDACQGDSGSSMTYVRQDERAVLIGVISWGVGCGRSHSPGVYASVQYHYDWLARQVCRDQDTIASWCSAYVFAPTPSPSSITPVEQQVLPAPVQPTTTSGKGASQKERASSFYSTESSLAIAQRTIDSSSATSSTIPNVAGLAQDQSNGNVIRFWETTTTTTTHSECKPSDSQCWLGTECCSGICRNANSSYSVCWSASPIARRGKRTRGARVRRRSGN